MSDNNEKQEWIDPCAGYREPIARRGEQQFAAVLRNRSGIDAGSIDFAARFIDGLNDHDQQDAVESAYSIYLKWCDETGKRSRRDTIAHDRQSRDDSEWINHPQTIEAKRQWDAVAAALGADGDDPEAVLAAAKAKSEAKDLQAIVDNIAGGVMAQREEVLRAFVAKYGFQPDEAVQVVGNDGSWHVIRHSEMYRKPETVEVTDAMVRTLASHVDRIFDVEDASDSAFIADMRFALEAALQADAGGEGRHG